MPHRGLLLALLCWSALAAGQTGSPSPADAQTLFNQVFGQRARTAPSRPVAMPLLIDGAERGLVNVTRTGSAMQFDRKALIALLRDWLHDEAWQRIEALPGTTHVDAADLAQAGLAARYDPVRIAVELEVPLSQRRLRRIDLSARRAPGGAPAIPPADFSAYLNARLSSVETSTQGALFAARNQQLAFDGAARLHGVVLESETRLLADNSTQRWRRGDTRLVRDDVPRLSRYSLGDVAPAAYGFLNAPALLGFGVERRFDIDPLNSYRPAPAQRVRIESPTAVDVVVNNRTVRTLRLDPGVYSLDNLPVATGANDVTLRINEPGGRVRTESLRFFFDPQLLKAGASQYSAALGAPLSIGADGRRYAGAQGQAWLRHGIADTLTAGGGIQADPRGRLVSTEGVVTGPLGTLGATWGWSTGEYGSGQSLRLQYRWQDSGTGAGFRTLQAQAQWNTREFNTPGARPGSVAHDLSLRWSVALTEQVQATASARRREFFDSPGSTGATLGMRMRLNREATIDFSWDHNSGNTPAPRHAFFVTFRWVPDSGGFTLAAQHDSQDSRRTIDAAHVHAADTYRFAAGARLAESSFGREQAVRARFENARLEADARLAQDLVNGAGSRTREWSLAGALAYAAGEWGVMRPIRDSFVLIKPHPRLAGSRVLVDPVGERAVARTDGLGAPALAQVSAYVPRQLILDAEGAPAGFEFGDDRPVILPGYRSGTVVPFGLGIGVALSGVLERADGSPLALASGELVATGERAATSAVAFFTNRLGRFRTESLRAGTYRLHVQGAEVPVATITIGADEEGARDLGVLRVPSGRGQ